MAESTVIENNQKTPMPFVFISHDTRDAEYAEAFSNLLKVVSAGVLKSFRTSDKKGKQGIEFGVEWYPEIIKNIQGATDVVCLLTENSINRPWILFEAGMAKGKLDTPILGVALGIELKDASTGPFAQFQNCGDEEESLTSLMMQLVSRIPNAEPDRETVKFQVGKFKKTISEIISRNKTKAGKIKQEDTKSMLENDLENSSVKLFEEIKIMFKDLPSRLERSSNNNIRRKPKFHPMMIDEMMNMSKNRLLGIRIALSFYKDKFPWVYDEGIAILNNLSSPKISNNHLMQALPAMDELLMIGTRMPFVDDCYDNEGEFMMVKELPRFIMRSLERYIDERKMSNKDI
jgi:hypothetical protein